MANKKLTLTYYDLEDNIAEETVWIKSLNDKEYQIKNIPFYAPNIAYNDIVKVEDDEGVLYFDEVIKASEHSTIQIVFFKEGFSEIITKDIELLGCSWEGMHNQKIIAIDVPPDINYNKIKEYLNVQFSRSILDYKEACLSQTHSKNIQ